MKTLQELQSLTFDVSSTEMVFSRIKDLPTRLMDMDVFLPTLNMNLQRDLVWSLQQKQELIISVFYKRYIPYISVMSLVNYNTVSDDKIQIIDGKQRLTTFLSFLNNEFSIDIDGECLYFKDLPDEYQREYRYYDIRCQIAYEDYDKRFTDQDKIAWFNLINFCGTTQDRYHMNKLKGLI